MNRKRLHGNICFHKYNRLGMHRFEYCRQSPLVSTLERCFPFIKHSVNNRALSFRFQTSRSQEGEINVERAQNKQTVEPHATQEYNGQLSTERAVIIKPIVYH